MKRVLKAFFGSVIIVAVLMIALSELLSFYPKLRGSTDSSVEVNFTPA